MGRPFLTSKPVTAPCNYVGDGQFIHLEENNTLLNVAGDGCKVVIEKNYGKIKILGDGCYLSVKNGIGDITWKGDFGKIEIGSEVIDRNVRCSGDGCKIVYAKTNTPNKSVISNNKNKSSYVSVISTSTSKIPSEVIIDCRKVLKDVAQINLPKIIIENNCYKIK